MNNLVTAPIAFFAFKRPEHTRRTLAALAANELAADTDLHIFCDGPRSKADERGVEQVREICRNVTGFASLHVHEHSVNQGLANSLFAGLNDMFEKHDRIIVIEDDILASPGTLRFLNTCLERYQDESVIFSISAWSPDPKKLGFPGDYPWDVYFFPRFHCWGWASWKDRWQSVDRNVPAAPALFDDSYALRAFSQGGADLPPMLRAALAGELDTWDVQTDFARFKHGRLGLNPVHAYTENIGFDNTGTNYGGDAPQNAVDVSLALDPGTVRFPEYIFVDAALSGRYRNFLRCGNGFCGSHEAQHLHIEDLEQQLAYYTNSRIVQGTLQLRDIAKRRAWWDLFGWSWRATRFVARRLLGRTKQTPAAAPVDLTEHTPRIPKDHMTANKHFPMTWEQAVEWLRNQPEQQDLVRACYFDDPLREAAKRFHQSEEWAETRKRLPDPPGKALDLGAGRGISSYALALDGFDVIALEPDPSPLVGAGAVQSLAEASGLPITVVREWGERLPFADHSFDLVHGRQVLHHAHSLPDLCREAARVLKPGGVFIATREHVVDRPEELPIFLANHALHHLFGGENAFSLSQYISAMDGAGFRFREILAPFDSAVNFFPLGAEELTEHMRMLWRWPWMPSPPELVENARRVCRAPGRLFTFVASAPDTAMPEEAVDKLRHVCIAQQALHDALQAALEETNRRLDSIETPVKALLRNLRHSSHWFFRKLRAKCNGTASKDN